MAFKIITTSHVDFPHEEMNVFDPCQYLKRPYTSKYLLAGYANFYQKITFVSNINVWLLSQVSRCQCVLYLYFNVSGVVNVLLNK